MVRISGGALYQWDTGRYVTVTDIMADHVHFSNKGDSKAVIMDFVDSQAKIPDYLLQTGKQLCVYVVSNGVTVESQVFSVNHRERPENYVYEEDQRNFIYELIASAENATEAASQAAVVAAQNAQKADESAERSNTAAKAAEIASDNANKAAANATQTAKSLMVVGDANGAVIRLDDAIKQPFVDFHIFGKTTQNGVPTLAAPVALVNIADKGTVSLNVMGKNILPYPFYQTTLTLNGITYTDNKDGTLSVSGTTTNPSSFWFTGYNFLLKKGVAYTLSVGNEFTAAGNPYVWVNSSKKGIVAGINLTSQKTVTFVPVEDVLDAGIYISAAQVGMAINGKIKPQIEVGTVATSFEMYKVQKLTIATPNRLPGVPVASGGNYTDANGQQWICDEIDFVKGAYVQRVACETVTLTFGEEDSSGRFRQIAAFENAYKGGNTPCLCNIAEWRAFGNVDNSCCVASYSLYYRNDSYTLEEINAKIGNTPITIVAVLNTPIEVPLSEEELAAYGDLRTYRGHTTISNDGHAYMELEYVMDAKKYIDSLVGSSTIHQATVE